MLVSVFFDKKQLKNISNKDYRLKRRKRRAVARPLFGVIKPYVYYVCGIT